MCATEVRCLRYNKCFPGFFPGGQVGKEKEEEALQTLSSSLNDTSGVLSRTNRHFPCPTTQLNYAHFMDLFILFRVLTNLLCGKLDLLSGRLRWKTKTKSRAEKVEKREEGRRANDLFNVSLSLLPGWTTLDVSPSSARKTLRFPAGAVEKSISGRDLSPPSYFCGKRRSAQTKNTLSFSSPPAEGQTDTLGSEMSTAGFLENVSG